MFRWKYPSVGALCCTALAAGWVAVFDEAQLDEALLPLLFLIVIIPIAVRFGHIAGILGTLASGLIFASFLKPKWSLAIADPAAKHHLIWMLIAGIVLSDLLGAYSVHPAARIIASKSPSNISGR